MEWFKNLSTRAKLVVSVGTVITLLIFVTVMARTGISTIVESQKRILEIEYANSIDLLELKAAQDEMRLALLMMISMNQRSDIERWHQGVKDTSLRVSKIVERLYERNRSDRSTIKKVDEWISIRQAFAETRDMQLIPLIYEGKVEDARKLALGIQADRYEKMAFIAHELVKDAKENAEREIADSERRAREFVSIFIAVGVIAVGIGLFTVIVLNSMIAFPLREISNVAEKIASGDLRVAPSSLNRKDEVGALAQAFHTMVVNLQKQTSNILEAVNALSSSSNEIATTTAQLASSVEETAVAVTETTTTVEEVKQTATLSSQKARHVSDIAQKAVHVSQTGEKLVNETIAGINQIQEQMEYIGETIMKLSEHNQAIGEIIAAVDDLSEQSNLLAVNAAIEASKAGEYGKGFIIVAQEIKALAEQSKQSTKQVRSILSDIQKASTAAVMATEKGSKAVETTVRQSIGTGESIRELTHSINDASQAVVQIAASSQQQLVGMDQVALAMNNISQATTQNAAATKQVETTIRDLNNLGTKLKTMVDHYKV